MNFESGESTDFEWNYDEFEAIYNDWTGKERKNVKHLDIAKYMLSCIFCKFAKEGVNEESIEEMVYLYDKILIIHQKIAMMMFAESNIHIEKENFEVTQNMDAPLLYGAPKTRILFYTESMILYARNALDIAASFFSKLIFQKREDSFNKFSKMVIKSNDVALAELKDYFEKNSSNELSAYRLLCGTEKGRALRDIIVHQANINLDYMEYKENSDKEKLFLFLKDEEPLDFKLFVSNFVYEFTEIFVKTINGCNEFLNKRA